MSQFIIDYQQPEGDSYLYALEHRAIEESFDEVVTEAERVLDYLRRFERDFESMQRMLSDGVQNESYRAEEARKNQQDPSPYEMQAAAMNQRRIQNEYCLQDLRGAIRTLEDYAEAARRACYWGEELSRVARLRAKDLLVTMENYDAVTVGQPDLSHKAIKPIHKLTDGGA